MPNFIRFAIGLTTLPFLLGASEPNEIPISLEITTNLSFSRAALTSDHNGQIRIDPLTGSRQLGGGIIDLGGAALAGSATVHGEPGRAIRVEMPQTVSMSSSTGGAIEISDIQTNLSPAPRLDNFGTLIFQFGGRISVSGNVSGTFRGRVPITAEYE
jgi:Domain of unknown function (DUF4402)